MPKICFITTCMGRLDMLRRTLCMMVGQLDSSCLVVDYSCPDRVGDWLEANVSGVSIVRQPGHTTFNLSRARNAGATAADAEWLCFLDADIRLSPKFATTLIPILQTGHYYRPDPILTGTDGTFVVAKSDFERSGGFDELYQGYGGEDKDMFESFAFLSLTPMTFPAHLLKHLPHQDTERTRFYAEKNLWNTVTVHSVYRQIKFDLTKRSGTPLPLAARQAIYEKTRPKVLAWLAAGSVGPVEIRVHLNLGAGSIKDVVYRIVP